MTQSDQTKNRRTLTGVVVSDKTDQTVVVRVDRTVVHPKYGKRYQRSKKYHVQDTGNTSKIGDQVVFVETRPLSSKKRWRLVK
ncbi:30S ribosomal protein S17 [Patescibacteria group bacterium]|nr:30S ribosomal protein S17 [Patescibacteria group bacterium]MBU1705863.1 30S ribosomal protein S17 [Patescibacteria group bacterium]